MHFLRQRAVATVLVMLAWSVTPAVAPPATAAGVIRVVVNEFAPGQYVELRNVSEIPVDVGGVELWACGHGGVGGTIRLARGQVLAAGAFYLIASTSFTGDPVDQTYPGTLPDGGGAVLDADGYWLDGVAVVKDSPCGERDPAPACPASAAVGRDLSSTDTGRNAADFSCQPRTPGEPN